MNQVETYELRNLYFVDVASNFAKILQCLSLALLKNYYSFGNDLAFRRPLGFDLVKDARELFQLYELLYPKAALKPPQFPKFLVALEADEFCSLRHASDHFEEQTPAKDPPRFWVAAIFWLDIIVYESGLNIFLFGCEFRIIFRMRNFAFWLQGF